MAKKLNFSLVGLDGNAFALLGAFRKQARKEKWDVEEINNIVDEAMSGDYDHLVATLNMYCDNEIEYEEETEDYSDFYVKE